VCFQGNERFFAGRRGDLLRMTVELGFSAARKAWRYRVNVETPLPEHGQDLSR